MPKNPPTNYSANYEDLDDLDQVSLIQKKD